MSACKGSFRVASGRRQAMHDSFQHSLHAQASLGADRQRVSGVESDGPPQSFPYCVPHRRWAGQSY